MSPKTPKWSPPKWDFMNPLLSASLFQSLFFRLWHSICRVLVGDQQIVLMWNQECWLSKQSPSRDLVHRVFLGTWKHEFCQPGLAIIFIPVMQLCQQFFPNNIVPLNGLGVLRGDRYHHDLSLAFFYMSKHGRYFEEFPYIESCLKTGSQWSPWR